MSARKLRSEHFRADSLLAGEDHGARILTAADAETFSIGNALTVDADGNVVDSGTTPGGGGGGTEPRHLALGALAWDVPTLSAWTQTNTTSPATTTTQLGYGIIVNHPNDTATDGEWQLWHQTAPSTPYSFSAWFIHLDGAGGGANHSYAGIGFRESSSGGFHLIQIAGAVSAAINFRYRSARWSSVTAPVETYSEGDAFGSSSSHSSIDSGLHCFVGVTNDGTLRKCYVSIDGINYDEFDSRAFNDDITPNQIVFGNNSDNAGVQRTVFMGFKIRTGSVALGPA